MIKKIPSTHTIVLDFNKCTSQLRSHCIIAIQDVTYMYIHGHVNIIEVNVPNIPFTDGYVCRISSSYDVVGFLRLSIFITGAYIHTYLTPIYTHLISANLPVLNVCTCIDFARDPLISIL